MITRGIRYGCVAAVLGALVPVNAKNIAGQSQVMTCLEISLNRKGSFENGRGKNRSGRDLCYTFQS